MGVGLILTLEKSKEVKGIKNSEVWASLPSGEKKLRAAGWLPEQRRRDTLKVNFETQPAFL